MKKIIKGIRFDTEKSTVIGSHDHGHYPQSGDFSHWTATLYKTPKSGRFFLFGRGGAMTRFAERSPGGGTCGGEKLLPLTNAEALQWAETYLDTQTIEQHFDDQIVGA